jgi:hypothetical protein
MLAGPLFAGDTRRDLLYREGWCETREVFYKRRWGMDVFSLR